MNTVTFSYPEFTTSFNAFYSYYADVAFENYIEAQNMVLEFQDASSKYDPMILRHKVECKSMVSIVFSAMCIESYINFFLSKCLGDELYYNTYEKLSVASKVELAANLVLKDVIDQGEEPLTSLKSTINKRNDFVHNKCSERSKELEREIRKLEAMTLEKKKQYANRDASKAWIDDCLNDMKKKTKEAWTALKAIVELAKYFKKKCPESYPIEHIFQIGGIRSDEDENDPIIIQKRQLIEQFLSK